MTSLAALVVLGSIVASSAMAETVAAKFSGTSLKVTTAGVTIKKNGAEAKTCTLSGGAASGSVSGNSVWLFNNFGNTVFNCSGGTQLSVLLTVEAVYDTVTGQYTLRQSSGANQNSSPWGTYTTLSQLNGSWTNGSGTTNSTVTYNEAKVGQLNSGGGTITLSGTFTATTSSGTLITLSH
jgi:hypothetical protein